MTHILRHWRIVNRCFVLVVEWCWTDPGIMIFHHPIPPHTPPIPPHIPPTHPPHKHTHLIPPIHLNTTDTPSCFVLIVEWCWVAPGIMIFRLKRLKFVTRGRHRPNCERRTPWTLRSVVRLYWRENPIYHWGKTKKKFTFVQRKWTLWHAVFVGITKFRIVFRNEAFLP